MKPKKEQIREFSLIAERRKLYEEELSGKIKSAGRIFRKIRDTDKEFIKRLKKELHSASDMPETTSKQVIAFDWVRRIIDKLAGEKLT